MNDLLLTGLQKPLPKKSVVCLTPGTMIELCWNDGPNTIGVLLTRPKRATGDVSLHVWHPDNAATSTKNHVDHHSVHGKLGFLCS
jgi:hypothetical protein